MNWADDDSSEPGVVIAPPDDGEHSLSSGSISVLAGSTLALWSDSSPCPETRFSCELQIAPHRPVVVGRAEGHEVPYLDPAYRPTRIMPGTGEPILRAGGHGADKRVSR